MSNVAKTRENWSQLEHAAGPADDVPDAIDALHGTDPDAREEASTWLIDTCLYNESGEFQLYSSSLPVLAALAAFVDADAVDDVAEDVQADVADALVHYAVWAQTPSAQSSEEQLAALQKAMIQWPWLSDA